jgi:hypothetical protein
VLRRFLELTSVFPDGAECTKLAELASYSLQFYELVHLPALGVV